MLIGNNNIMYLINCLIYQDVPEHFVQFSIWCVYLFNVQINIWHLLY